MARILVADDIQDMRVLLTAILQKFGHTVVEASSGRGVVKILKNEDEEDFDLILLDVNMPELSGIEAMAKIKELSPDVKVCFISGDRDKKTVLSALSSGGHDYIVKPIDPAILQEKLKKLLGTGSTEDFAVVKLRAKAELLGLPMPIDFWVTELSEVHLTFESVIPFEEGGLIEIKAKSINEVVGEEIVFSCQSESVKKNKDKYFVRCSFVGVHENIRKKIRSLAMKGTKIDDTVEEAS